MKVEQYAPVSVRVNPPQRSSPFELHSFTTLLSGAASRLRPFRMVEQIANRKSGEGASNVKMALVYSRAARTNHERHVLLWEESDRPGLSSGRSGPAGPWRR